MVLKHCGKNAYFNDDFIRTTDERHEKVVRCYLQKLMRRAIFYKAEYEGWYCTPDETFGQSRS